MMHEGCSSVVKSNEVLPCYNRYQLPAVLDGKGDIVHNSSSRYKVSGVQTQGVAMVLKESHNFFSNPTVVFHTI